MSVTVHKEFEGAGDDLVPAGYWSIVNRHGNSQTIHVMKTELGTTIPRVDDSGGALRFYYPNGRRRIYSYSGMQRAEYVPEGVAP